MLSFARVRALAILAVLLVAAGVVVYQALSRDQQTNASAVTGCPAGFVPADLTLYDASEIRINVLNGTGRAGVAAPVGEQFANRGFVVLDRDDSPDVEMEDEVVALLRYGPAGVGAAHVLNAYFLNDSVKEFQIDRVPPAEDEEAEEGEAAEDEPDLDQAYVVDVVIGPGFRQLATETEVRQAIASSGNPDPPAGTCAADDHLMPPIDA